MHPPEVEGGDVRTQGDEDELYDEEEGDEAVQSLAAPPPPSALPTAPPPDSPDFLWLSPTAPGATLPDPKPMARDEEVFVTTRDWDRRRTLRIVGNALLQAGIFIGIVAVLNLDHLGAVPVLWWSIGVALGVVVLIGGLTRPGAVSLTLTEGGFSYEDGSFRIQSAWSNVARLVQLGGDEPALALRLHAPATAWERTSRAKPWRLVPYPWDTTVPLAPFTLGDPSREAQALVAGALPALQGVPSNVEAPHAETSGRRAIGFLIGLVPLGALAIVTNLVSGDAVPLALLRTAIIAGLGAMALIRWNGTTGERSVDYVARVILGPAKESKRSAIAVLLRTQGVFIAILLVTVALSLSVGAATASSLTAKYGPAHTCWKNDAGKISGCQLSDGTMRGTVGTTQVTCYFTEPVPSTPQIFHCR
jgi:hypothetical protein